MNTLAGVKIKSMSPQFLVKDIERSVEFYNKNFGFAVDFRVEDFYVGLVRDGYTLHLKSGNPSQEERKNKRHNEDLDVIFTVSDVDALYQELIAESVEVTQPLCERPYGKEFYIADPDVYILAFLSTH